MTPEELLRGYVIHVSIYRMLRDEYILMNAHGDIAVQNYSAVIQTGKRTRKPIEGYIERKETLEVMIEKLSRLIIPVSTLILDLSLGRISGIYSDSLMNEILHRYFFSNCSISTISRELNMSRNRVKRRIKKLIILTQEFMIKEVQNT